MPGEREIAAEQHAGGVGDFHQTLERAGGIDLGHVVPQSAQRALDAAAPQAFAHRGIVIHRAEPVGQKWDSAAAVGHDPADAGKFAERAIPKQVVHRPRGVEHQLGHPRGIGIGRHVVRLIAQRMHEHHGVAAVEFCVEFVLVGVAEMAAAGMAQQAHSVQLECVERILHFADRGGDVGHRQQGEGAEAVRMV
jgi:hypothetical protein